jgi:hypothetical protein
MLSTEVSLKDVARRRAERYVDLRPKTEATLVHRSPKRTGTGTRGSPRRRRPAEPACIPPIDSDLEVLLRAHAVQASMIANAAAVSVGWWLAFLDDGDCSNPKAALEITYTYERIRRSATEDLRRTTALVRELRRPPIEVTARTRVTDNPAEVIRPAPGPLTEADLIAAYTDSVRPYNPLQLEPGAHDQARA